VAVLEGKAMIRLLLAIALLLPFSAHSAEAVYTNQSTSIRLQETPCGSDLLRTKLAIKDGNTIQRAIVLYQGRTIEACWTGHVHEEKPIVLIVDEEGDGAFIARELFTHDPGI
jgi:hypothetical protein